MKTISLIIALMFSAAFAVAETPAEARANAEAAKPHVYRDKNGKLHIEITGTAGVPATVGTARPNVPAVTSAAPAQTAHARPLRTSTYHEIDITGKDYGDRYNIAGDGPINWQRFDDDWDNWKPGKPIKYDPDGMADCVKKGICSVADTSRDGERAVQPPHVVQPK